MSKLQDLKKAAADKLATVHDDVKNYVTALEGKVGTNRNLLIGAGIVCLIVGAFIGHALPHH